MINIINKIKKRRNTKNLEIASLKEELLKAYRKLDERNETINGLLSIKERLLDHIEDLLEENKELREKKTRKVK